MKKYFLIFVFILLSTCQASGENNHNLEHLGRRLGQMGFTLGCLTSFFCVAKKYQLAFGLGCLGLGSFLLSPVAQEVYRPSYQLNVRNIKKFIALVPCGVAGFALTTVGLKTIHDMLCKILSQPLLVKN